MYAVTVKQFLTLLIFL
uniref:Uncharacterized protein n=1 Tax=Anopheles arabiensis TaxID=7173 RepID=A0A182IH17_ANOAR